MTEHLLSVQGLCCIRGDLKLFSGLDFSLRTGDLLHLTGHNGSGKTTLLRTLCGLLIPEAGEIQWQGTSISHLREDYAKDLLYLGHLNGIKGDLTAVENLRMTSVLDGHVISEEAAWDALKEIGLSGHEDLPAKVLSQGQKRRVALARLLINKSPLWMLDEPFTALDKAAVQMLERVISGHLQSGGMVILTTHQDVELTRGDVRTLKLGWRNV